MNNNIEARLELLNEAVEAQDEPHTWNNHEEAVNKAEEPSNSTGWEPTESNETLISKLATVGHNTLDALINGSLHLESAQEFEVLTRVIDNIEILKTKYR